MSGKAEPGRTFVSAIQKTTTNCTDRKEAGLEGENVGFLGCCIP